MVFKVTIEEMISETFEIEASDLSEAMAVIEKEYKRGLRPLESPHLVCTQLHGYDPKTGESTDWVEI